MNITKKEKEELFKLISNMGKNLSDLKKEVDAMKKAPKTPIDELADVAAKAEKDFVSRGMDLASGLVQNIELEIGFQSTVKLDDEQKEERLIKITSELKDIIDKYAIHDLLFKYRR